MTTSDDRNLRTEVLRELEWEPGVDDHRIGVAVTDGVVTLSGEVQSYAERWKAERAVERVKGVRGIVNELSVRTAEQSSDVDLARAVTGALEWNVLVPADRIKVKVERGWVTLEGTVSWDFQRRAAERAVRNLRGVMGITNLIHVRPKVEPDQLKERIEQSLERAATGDAQRLDVDVNGSEVILRGRVRSWLERREAEEAAWSAPGVTAVKNLITVDPLLATV